MKYKYKNKNFYISHNFKRNLKNLIDHRISSIPLIEQNIVIKTMEFLYDLKGKNNLPKNYRKSFPFLTDGEKIAIQWIRNKITGKGRKKYGIEALQEARKAQYKCQDCGESDVRTLQMDHKVNSKNNLEFQCLCANCHHIESRRKSWQSFL